MKDQLVFDTTDANTIADSDNVGAYLRSDDGTRLTHTTDGSREALDVYTELGQAEDSAHTSGDLGAMALAVRNDTEGTLVDTDGDYAPLQVDSSGRLRVVADLDTTNLAEKAEDSAHASGDIGNYVLTVREDTLSTSTSADGDYQSFKTNASGELYVVDTAGNTLLGTIDADTSILSAAIKNEDDAAASGDAGFPSLLVRQDTLAASTSADGDYGNFKSNNLGELYVVDTSGNALLTTIDADTSTIAGDTTSIDSTLTALSKAEDSVHASGDQGIMSLAVRNDAGTALAADGDYIPFTTDSTGALRVTSASSDDALANTAIANAANPLTAANTAEDVVVSPLANRKYLWIYNNGNRRAFIGASGVSAADGFPIAPRSYVEMRAGASVDIEWVSVNTSQEIRTLELS
jgi:hypothetical protein